MLLESPSTWREWIEILTSGRPEAISPSLPPLGGSGLKSIPHINEKAIQRSPSTWREWIEIITVGRVPAVPAGLPPLGGSGLKLCSYLFLPLIWLVSLHLEGVD